MSCDCCDVGVQFRQWLLAIPEVTAWCGQRVIDTVDENQTQPFIWFSRSGGNAGDTLTPCGSDCLMSEIYYDIEVIDDVRRLAQTRRIAEIIRRAANTWNYERYNEPFGDADAEFYVQMIEVDDVNDDYIPKVAQYVDGIAWTSMNVEITPR